MAVLFSLCALSLLVWPLFFRTRVAFSLLWFMPGIGVSVRRMHDIGRSGLWSFVPVVGLVMACIPGLPEANMYGPNPTA